MAIITLSNIGKAGTTAGSHGSGERAEDSGTYKKLLSKKPAAPIVGNTAVKQGPHANSKSNAAGKEKTAGIKANGSMQHVHGKNGGTARTEAPMSPMGRAAKKLYPSAK